MLSKWDREKLISYLYVESKKNVKLVDTGNRLVVARGGGDVDGWNGWKWSKGTKFSL